MHDSAQFFHTVRWKILHHSVGCVGFHEPLLFGQYQGGYAPMVQMGPSKVMQHRLTLFCGTIHRWLLWLIPPVGEELCMPGVVQGIGLVPTWSLGWPSQILYWHFPRHLPLSLKISSSLPWPPKGSFQAIFSLVFTLAYNPYSAHLRDFPFKM